MYIRGIILRLVLSLISAFGLMTQTVFAIDLIMTPYMTLKGHKDYVNSISFSPDGKLLASGGKDANVFLWDTTTGDIIKTLSGHGYDVNSVSFSPAGKILASASKDNTIIIWDVATGDKIKTINGSSYSINSVSFSSDGKTLTSRSDDETANVWDTETWRRIGIKRGDRMSFQSTLSADGKLRASRNDDDTISVWDAETGGKITTLKGHSDFIRTISFSPDRKMLASGSKDTTVLLWDIKEAVAIPEPTVVVESTGCELDSDGDGVHDCSDICLNTPAGTKIDEAGCPVQIIEKISIDLKIEFATNKADIRKVYFDRLEKVAQFLNNFPDTEAVIEGHTDNVGSEKHNLKLSQRRADSVKTFLTDKYGIAPSRLKANGFGESMPIADNDTADGKQRNRRVIAIISTVVIKQEPAKADTLSAIK